ncbi:hypothetical protein [Peribacillus deserti]|uniref:Uncharacterized protein n=1 Tax=Peribacillus deserti TaxID=673318 RepID=A0A2N5MA21_9BACI|nr:hypothetical protein [Peribacillus deserti]PLT31210.1 hypothetical protein CUU66_03960 [Peribacillus deserti]
MDLKKRLFHVIGLAALPAQAKTPRHEILQVNLRLFITNVMSIMKIKCPGAQRGKTACHYKIKD